MTELGIFAKTFPRPSLEAALAAVAATGLRTTQLNLALLGGPSLPDAIPAAAAERVRAAAAAHGLRAAAVSGTWNMAHPDPAVRADGVRRLDVLIAAAPALGTRIVTLCTGTRDPEDMWRAHPGNGTPEAWRDLLGSLEPAVAAAERHGVVLGVEPEHANVVASAADARRLLDELRSPALRVVVDPANLVADGDLRRQDAVLEEAFALLGDDLVLAHAKDVRAGGAIVPAGHGDLDYDRYLALLADVPDVPLILHGLAEEDVPGCVAFLRRRLGG